MPARALQPPHIPLERRFYRGRKTPTLRGRDATPREAAVEEKQAEVEEEQAAVAATALEET